MEGCPNSGSSVVQQLFVKQKLFGVSAVRNAVGKSWCLAGWFMSGFRALYRPLFLSCSCVHVSVACLWIWVFIACWFWSRKAHCRHGEAASVTVKSMLSEQASLCLQSRGWWMRKSWFFLTLDMSDIIWTAYLSFRANAIAYKIHKRSLTEY